MEDYLGKEKNNKEKNFQNANSLSNYKTYAKVFLYFGLALLITAVVSIGMATLFFNLLINDPETFATTAIITMVVSIIALFVLSFVINRFAYKTGSSLLIPYILYSVAMGALLSGIAFYVDSPYTLGLVFLFTAVVFILMALLGLIIKDKIGTLFTMLLGLVIGVGLMCLLNLVILPFALAGSEASYEAYKTFYWVGEILFLFIFMIYVAIDMYRLKKTVESGSVISTNLALYFATSLYTDFINLFLRILYIVMALKDK